MRIEVINKNENPQVFTLDKPRMILGSLMGCDICIDSPSVSRKHISLQVEGDKVLISDLGSTNGTYLNDDRIVPGRAVELTSFLPIRLGDDVLLTLLLDDEAPGELIMLEEEPAPAPKPVTPPPQRDLAEQTRIISLNDLRNAKTDKLVKRRQDLAKKATSEKKKKEAEDRERMRGVAILAAMIVGVAYYFNFYKKEEPVVKAPIVRAQAIEQRDAEVEALKKSRTLAEEDLPPLSTNVDLYNVPKCTTDKEKYFCAALNSDPGNWGAIQVGSTMKLVVNGEPYLREAMKLLGAWSPEFTTADLRKVMTMQFFTKGLPSAMDTNVALDVNIAVAFFLPPAEGRPESLQFVAAIKGAYLGEMKTLLTPELVQNLERIGPSTFNQAEEFVIYQGLPAIPEPTPVDPNAPSTEVAPDVSSPQPEPVQNVETLPDVPASP